MNAATRFRTQGSLFRLARFSVASAALALSLGTLAVAGTGLGLTPAAVAQEQGGGGGGQTGGRHRMAEALMSVGLSDGQKSQIRGIMSDARAKSQNADQDTRRANFKAAFAKIDSVLTPDQRTRFRAKMDQIRKEREQGTSPQS